MKAFYVLAILVACGAPAAHADGINLSWDDCGTFGQPVKTFACNFNFGSNMLVASVVPPAPLPQFNALEAIVDIVAGTASISPWWDFGSTGCRPRQVVFDNCSSCYPALINCAELWLGMGAATAVYYTGGFGAPNVARVRALLFVADPIAVTDLVESYAFQMNVRRAKTVGEGSCPGCLDGACIVLQSIKLMQLGGAGDYLVTTPLNRTDAYWQCPGLLSTEPGPCTVSCPVPARSRTWGGIKSLYR